MALFLLDHCSEIRIILQISIAAPALAGDVIQYKMLRSRDYALLT